MDDFFTRISVWMAMVAYAVAVVLQSRARLDGAKFAWSVGCLCYMIHVVFAFGIHYQWSHQIAESQTAAQTEELTGIRTNIGIYVNYLFTIVWALDAGYWLLVGSERYSKRPQALTTTIHLFFIFMIFNGAVVFASGPARWIGLVVLAVVLANWIALRAKTSKQ